VWKIHRSHAMEGISAKDLTVKWPNGFNQTELGFPISHDVNRLLGIIDTHFLVFRCYDGWIKQRYSLRYL
jgi:hypothetical protein